MAPTESDAHSWGSICPVSLEPGREDGRGDGPEEGNQSGGAGKHTHPARSVHAARSAHAHEFVLSLAVNTGNTVHVYTHTPPLIILTRMCFRVSGCLHRSHAEINTRIRGRADPVRTRGGDRARRGHAPRLHSREAGHEKHGRRVRGLINDQCHSKHRRKKRREEEEGEGEEEEEGGRRGGRKRRGRKKREEKEGEEEEEGGRGEG
ncbi:unnamed protein product [Pleuronectes platessa]|uniref:Uncharacterized protein n=1 Tax=Pleuronectes platessa TaxID=8262 RepID=A0A9N7YN40_PLEPL|nr:unnamed protein product [Pleuronectes platessa]